MAAYGALVSVMHIIEQLQHHPRPPITLDKIQIKSLRENITFLQDFLEVYNSHYSNPEVEHLRNCIADAAYAAEDTIESHIVDQIHAQSSTVDAAYAIELYQGLQKVIENMDSIKKEVLEIKEKIGNQEQLQGIITTPAAVSSKSSSTQHNTMVGFDDVLTEMLDKLTCQRSDRQVIPIVGMGGIGKTTLARNVYENQLVVEYFDVRAWVTVSQEYNTKLILLDILCQENQDYRKTLSRMSEAELGEMLYKSLYGRRYLIVMDDIWSNDVWDKIKLFFPKENNGSRVIVTTRLANVASYLTSNCGLEIDFLNQDESWSLFCKTVFGEDDCPSELEHIGMEIVQNCEGLPLSIVVLGGLLAKSKLTREYWQYIVENLNLIVNLAENERCLKVLHTSYEQLPAHLKACFLYMGTFPEDSNIRVSELIKLWVAEGFLKPISGKSLEESAEEYLIDLIDRNLILVSERGHSGKIKFCNIHDLLRDLCLREAQKEKFICVANQHSENLNTQRRIAFHQDTSKKEYLHSMKAGSSTRSLICYSQEDSPIIEPKLLRVFKRIDIYIKDEDKTKCRLNAIFQLVNLRYLALTYSYTNDPSYSNLIFPSSVSLLWNLQTLIVNGWDNIYVAPPEIWKMPLLRHVESTNVIFPDPPSDMRYNFVLENLYTLAGIKNLKFGEEVVKRIPNVKKLLLYYDDRRNVASYYCLNNLGRLDKLESLFLIFDDYPISRDDLLQNLIFPHSLKKLTLCESALYWEDMSTKIGSLPLLQVLKLDNYSFRGRTWQTSEGQFCSLKYLHIGYCEGLEYWITESTHFPRLEHLVLAGLDKLKEIPSGIGEIETFKSIQLKYCSNTAIISAKQILDEQEELANESLRVTVILQEKKQEELANDRDILESLASRNFQVKFL